MVTRKMRLEVMGRAYFKFKVDIEDKGYIGIPNSEVGNLGIAVLNVLELLEIEDEIRWMEKNDSYQSEGRNAD